MPRWGFLTEGQFMNIEMTSEKLMVAVKKIVAANLDVPEADIKDNSSFVDDLRADSLDTVELVMAFEEEFNCEISDEQAEKLKTIQDAVDFIKSHYQGQGLLLEDSGQV